ncbi:MAG TPA: histidine kinase dimerization/phospho-acceptor domain-containing protein, partial [Polyangiaceae bacterium]
MLLLQAIEFLLLLALGISLAWKADPNAPIALCSAAVLVPLFEAYRRGWEPARPLTVVIAALMLVLGLDEPHLTVQPSMAIFVPPMLALVLASGRWVIAVSIIEYVALVLRSGAGSIYLVPNQMVLFACVVAGLALGRSLMDDALARAAAQRDRAEEARREAERHARELLERQARLALLGELLDAVDQAIFACDSEGRIVYANRASRVIALVRDCVGRSLDSVLKLESSNAATALDRLEPGAHDLVLCRPDGGKVPTLVVHAPAPGAAGAGVASVTVCTDVSRVKGLEEELSRAQRLEAIGRLAGGVAHDFNNLLTVMGGAASMAQRRLPAGHRALEELEEIVVAVQRAGELTRQLLAFARKQVLVRRPVDLSMLVMNMERMLRRVIGEHIV